MLIDRYFDQLFHNVPRIPTRLVRYGIIHTNTLRDTLWTSSSRASTQP